MSLSMQKTHYGLARRELLVIDAVGGHMITCESGELWITIEEPQDVILGPGESFRAWREAVMVVSALRDSTLTLAGLLRRRVAPLAAAVPSVSISARN